MHRAWGAAALAALSFGCSRGTYRARADADAFQALREHVVSPALDPGPLALERSAESRLHAPDPPPCPAMPADDPAARRFMDFPDGIRNCWPQPPDQDGVPAAWEAGLRRGADGKVKLDAKAALELALLHSREYQTEAESLYLSALALTLNRFDFDVQGFARQGAVATFAGAGATRSNTLGLPSDLGFTRNLAAGGQILVDFANAFVVDFGGGPVRATSSLAFGLAQPLLRGGGRPFRLENLALAERATLYQLRTFARFRKQFWSGITVQNGGYLSLLLSVQTIRNQQSNLASQEQNFRLHQELFRNGGQVSRVQVDQAFQSWQQARVAVLQAENALQDGLDDFKLRLGLPPRVDLALDDAPLKPFQLSDEALEQARTALDALQKAENQTPDGPPPLAEAVRLHRQLKEAAAGAVPWVAKVEAERKAWAAARPPAAGAEPEDAERRQRDDEAAGKFAAALAELKAAAPKLAEDVAAAGPKLEKAKAPKALEDEWNRLLRDTQAVAEVLDQLLSIQTQVRISRLALRPVPHEEAEALRLARAQRLDLQNAVAQRMDAWRAVEVAANRLKADLAFNGKATFASRGTSANPFAFDARAGSYALGLQFDSPLVRRAERNAFRAALVGYQRSRRTVIDLEDRIDRAVRGDLRAMRLQRRSFEISRQSLLAAARQVEGARERLRARGQNLSGGSSTLDVLNALNALLDARNALAGNYIQYEQQRVGLLLDLEQIQLGPDGAPRDESDLGEPVPGAKTAGERPAGEQPDSGKSDGDGPVLGAPLPARLPAAQPAP